MKQSFIKVSVTTLKNTILVLLISLGTQNAFCQGNQFVGEIKLFAGNFAPNGWAKCEGQLLPISQNTALFSLLGTYYGGDGKTTFALPDLRGKAPMHVGGGDGPGLSSHYVGEISGEENVTLLTTEIPSHNHTINVVNSTGNKNIPTDCLPANTLTTDKDYSNTNANTTMNSSMIAPAGGNQPVNNTQPYLSVTFIIALQGIFPPRQ